MNIRLLRRAEKAMLEEPRRASIGDWVWHSSAIASNKRKAPACGTVGCIYGWGKALTAKLRGEALYNAYIGDCFNDGVLASAAAMFELSFHQSQRLCLTSYWPHPFRSRILKTRPQTKAHVKVIVGRIEHFIKTKGE